MLIFKLFFIKIKFKNTPTKGFDTLSEYNDLEKKLQE